MDIIATGTFTDRTKIGPLLSDELERVHQLHDEGFIVEPYLRADKSGVVLILRAGSLEEAQERLSQLPFGKAGLLTFDFVEVGPL